MVRCLCYSAKIHIFTTVIAHNLPIMGPTGLHMKWMRSEWLPACRWGLLSPRKGRKLMKLLICTTERAPDREWIQPHTHVPLTITHHCRPRLLVPARHDYYYDGSSTTQSRVRRLFASLEATSTFFCSNLAVRMRACQRATFTPLCR